jgi:recombination protein RecA
MADALSKLNSVLDDINKKHGKGSALVGNEVVSCDKISSGAISLDIALGGGYGEGRIIEIYGPESAGKTLLAVTGAIQAQKKHPEKYVAIIDAEHAIDLEFCKKLGLDTERVIVNQPDYGEQGFDIAEALIKSGQISYCIIDSVSALIPKTELDGDMDANQMGLQARMMSKALRKITGIVNQSGTVVVFINQLRDKIGVMFGSPETTSGGNALKFFASQRLDVRKKQGKTTDEQGDIMNTDITVKVVKNKLAPPFRKAELVNIFNVGIDATYDLTNMCVKAGIIAKSGSWFSYGETRLGQGMDNTVKTIKENPDLFDELETQIKEHYGIGK